MVKVREIAFVILVLLSLVLAWLLGWLREQVRVDRALMEYLPAADYFEKATDHVYVGYMREPQANKKVGYVGQSLSWANDNRFIEVAVGVDPEGIITSVTIVRHNEIAAYMNKIVEIPPQLLGKRCNDPFIVGQGMPQVEGAGPALEHFAQAVREASGRVAHQLDLTQNFAQGPRLVLGWPELVLALLYGSSFLAYGRKTRFASQLRWGSLIGGFLVLGLWLKNPMSLVHVNALLLGYWPSWQTHVYWYMLVGGVLLPILLTGRSLYCEHLCPFGAIQQGLTGLGHAQREMPVRIRFALRWIQRALVWIAILCALIWRNPVVVHYEIAGTLFSRDGRLWQFVLLAVVLVGAMFISRPWCNSLCPIRALTDFSRLLRRCVGCKDTPCHSCKGPTEFKKPEN